MRTGGCLCGAVRFEARDVPGTYGVCHCSMCRRWNGSALFGVTVKETNVTFDGAEKIARRQSSKIAERAWCSECGTPLFYRVTAENEWAGNLEFPLGLFDDPNGFTLSHEIFIDHKPDGFALADQGQKTLTRADCVAKFPALDEI